MQKILNNLKTIQDDVNSFMIRKDVDPKTQAKVAAEFNKTLDMVIEMTAPFTIERLVRLEELKKQ